jgi:hypothetical protein
VQHIPKIVCSGKKLDWFFLWQDIQNVDLKKLQHELERGEYIVEEVLAKKKIDGMLHYLVCFVGNPKPKWVKPQKSFAKAIKKFQSKGKKQPELTKNVPVETMDTSDIPGKVKQKGRLKKVIVKKLVKKPVTIVPKVVKPALSEPTKMSLSKQLALAAKQGIAIAISGRVTRSQVQK